jgi:rSAM/selenodomain-associated transferase 1
MAKAPVAGHAKTRLIPALGADGAAALAARLLAHTLQTALAAAADGAAGLGPVELCCTPDPQHAAFDGARRNTGLEFAAQGDGDLGARMQRALARRLASHGRALLIGTDAPALDATTLQRAATALRTHDAVFVPALDGGYALIGLARPVPGLFEAMPWSTSRVMALTRERLAAAGIRHAELPPVHDIDEPADLVHLPGGWAI